MITARHAAPRGLDVLAATLWLRLAGVTQLVRRRAASITRASESTGRHHHPGESSVSYLELTWHYVVATVIRSRRTSALDASIFSVARVVTRCSVVALTCLATLAVIW